MLGLLEFYNKNVLYPKNKGYFHSEEKDQFVYLIFCFDSKLCKIGISNDTNRRITSLINSCGLEMDIVLNLELLRDYDVNYKQIERLLHDFFKSKRIKGEWFNLNIKDIIGIRSLFYYIEGENIEDNLKEILTKYNFNNLSYN